MIPGRRKGTSKLTASGFLVRPRAVVISFRIPSGPNAASTDRPEPSGLGNGGGQFGERHRAHPGANDWIVETKQITDWRLQHWSSTACRFIRLWRNPMR